MDFGAEKKKHPAARRATPREEKPFLWPPDYHYGASWPARRRGDWKVRLCGARGSRVVESIESRDGAGRPMLLPLVEKSLLVRAPLAPSGPSFLLHAGSRDSRCARLRRGKSMARQLTAEDLRAKKQLITSDHHCRFGSWKLSPSLSLFSVPARRSRALYPLFTTPIAIL